MGGFLVLLSLFVFAIAVIALIRGHLDWARISTRRVGLFVLLGSLVVFIVGGTLLPPPPKEPASAISPTTEPTTPAPTATPSTTAPVPGAPADVQGPFQVVEVVDGDTYKIARPEGVTTLRLIGIDTPETRNPDRPVECYGEEATQAAQQLVGSQNVWVHSDPTQDAQDRYGRDLVYVWLADGTLVNERLIRAGAGIEYTYAKPYEYQTEFRATQDEARQAGRGLWAATTCNGNAHLAAQQSTTPIPTPQPTQAPVPPAPAPAPAPVPAPATQPSPPPKPPSGEPYYANCAAARAAGAAPLHRGEPGYRSGLDRDNDGVACE